MKFQPNKFDKIIFDMDGVITSEYIYWDTAALTVYELLYSHQKYGRLDIDREWCIDNYTEIRRVIFDGGKTIRAVKNLGVNTNWDLAYIVFCISKYIDSNLSNFDDRHFMAVRMFIENITVAAPEVYDLIAGLAAQVMPLSEEQLKRGSGDVWHEMHQSFQRWFEGHGGIPGLNMREEPIISLGSIKETLARLKESGIKLGIGTGRPKNEILLPMRMWGLDEYFEPSMIATYDDVLNAERKFKPDFPIAKPHPFVFLKAALGYKYSDGQLLARVFSPEEVESCAVVGDAPSDFLAARAANMKFVGVLTGIDKNAADKYFRENKADHIFDDMTGLTEFGR